MKIIKVNPIVQYKIPGAQQYESIMIGLSAEIEIDSDGKNFPEQMSEIWDLVNTEIIGQLPPMMEDEVYVIGDDKTMKKPQLRSVQGKTVNDHFESPWLTPSDLKGKWFTLTISQVGETTVKNPFRNYAEETVIAIGFKETEKMLLCKTTRAGEVAEAVGSDAYDDWVGKKIRVGPGQAKNNKATIAIRAAEEQAQKKPDQPKTKQRAFMKPAKLRDVLHQAAAKKGEAGNIDTKLAQLIAAKLTSVFVPVAEEGVAVQARGDQLDQAKADYHLVLNWLWPVGDPPSAKNLTQGEGLTMVNWLLETPKDGFKSELSKIAVAEAVAVLKVAKEEKPVQGADDEIPF